MKAGTNGLLLLLVFCLWTSTASAQGLDRPGPSSAFPQGVNVYKDLAYVPKGHFRQKLDIYVPESPESSLPLIVWIHGGGWQHGSKEGCLPLQWTAKGYVVASIDYRLSQDACFPAQFDDGKSAIRWLRIHSAEYKIDPDRVVAWGASAGGHLASLLGTAVDEDAREQGHQADSSRVQGVIDWFGRADLTRICIDPALAHSPSAMLLGGSGSGVGELARKASPIMHVSQDDPPFLIMHGDKDGVVPLDQSRAFAKALKAAGVKVNLVVLKGAGHGGEEFLQPDQVKVIDAFLNENLGRPVTARSR